MSTATTFDSHLSQAQLAQAQLAQALPEVIADLRRLAATLSHPKLGDLRWIVAIRDTQHDLAAKLATLREHAGKQLGELGAHLDTRRVELIETLTRLRADLQQGTRVLAEKTSHAELSRETFRDLGAKLTRGYEDLVEQVKALKIWKPTDATAARALRLPRPARSLFHVMAGVSVVLLYHFVFERAAGLKMLLGFAATAAAMEISRRFSRRLNDFWVDKVFGLISRPRERYQTNSATYYLFAILFITWIAPQPAVCLAILTLAFGDPTASLVGARWGKLRIYNDKSLLGSSAFFVAAFAASMVYLAVAVAPMSALRMIAIAASISATGTITELFSDRLDDNLTIPLAAAAVGMLWF
ncbi:MAG: hypothetical protein KAI47_03085 [Deltaproteobacteria bacterium]|nr:hypothetical protein [Deltaproteobacteria bacterium]